MCDGNELLGNADLDFDCKDKSDEVFDECCQEPYGEKYPAYGEEVCEGFKQCKDLLTYIR